MIDAVGYMTLFFRTAAAAPSVYALTGNGARVFGGTHLPPNYKPEQGQALLLNTRPGDIDYTSKVLISAFVFRSYGKTEELAAQLDMAVFDDLNDKKWGKIYMGRLDVPGQTLQREDTGWYEAFSFYQVWLRNE